MRNANYCRLKSSLFCRLFSADKGVLFKLRCTVLGKRKVLSESEIKPRLPEDFEV